MEIDKHERDELLARWQRCHREIEPGAPIDRAVAELIDEACRGVCQGRINTDRCAHAGETFGWAWRTYGMEPASMVEEIAAVRRSVWDTVVARLRAESAGLDALVNARTIIDLAFDVATRRSLDAILREPGPTDQPATAESAALEPSEDTAVSDFHAALETALASCGRRNVPVALIVLHFDVTTDTIDMRGHGEGVNLLDISEVLSLQLRHRDQAFALTDSDYAILCTDTNAAGARHLLSRISAAINLYARRAEVGIEVTGGFSVAPDDALTAVELIRMALADREFSISDGIDANRV